MYISSFSQNVFDIHRSFNKYLVKAGDPYRNFTVIRVS